MLLTSCGYQWSNETTLASKPSIYIPYIEGDEEGTLTSEVIAKIASSGIARIAKREAEYRLEVQMLSQQSDPIGWRRDPQKIKSKVRKNLTGCEERRSLEVEVAIFQGEYLYYGPIKLACWVDYDYVDGDSFPDLTFVNQHGVLTVVLPFSLGQLESIESAQEAATIPLYRQLAQKIVDAISPAW